MVKALDPDEYDAPSMKRTPYLPQINGWAHDNGLESKFHHYGNLDWGSDTVFDCVLTTYTHFGYDWMSDVVSDSVLTTYTHGGQTKDLRMLLVCRMIYQEASAIFYGQNTFYFDECDQVIPFWR